MSLFTLCSSVLYFFFFNDTATTEIYTLSLHDALPISMSVPRRKPLSTSTRIRPFTASTTSGRTSIVPRPLSSPRSPSSRSEEHTSELQSLAYLVCRLLLEKKKNSPNARFASTHHCCVR